MNDSSSRSASPVPPMLDSPRSASPPLRPKATDKSTKKAIKPPKIVLLPLLLALLAAWVGLLATYAAQDLYFNYLYPMVVRLERTADHETVRRTDSTYYLRPCTSHDMSIWEDQADELLLEPAGDGDDQATYYVDHMMRHGVAVIPQLLKPETAANLRKHIVDRNSKLTDADEIGIHPNYMRQAFAIDPAEHLSVQTALHELASNEILKTTVAGLVGDDPAITEMAALTSYTGAEAQDWHHDVLPEEGSAVQYARTYGHSYSLFIALQDTDSEMGATRLCPGSHMCGEAQNGVCDRHGFQPLLVEDDNGREIWRAGDGVLFNQQLCHRGEAQTSGPARVMFVVSFTARPKLGLDSRVLSKGLYCFSLWNIWGLTWQDLYFDSAKHTTNRLHRILRSLGVWKPASRNWGIDFVTKSIMEWQLQENGMEPYMLHEYANGIQKAIGFPKFLHGRIYKVSEDDDDNIESIGDVYHDYLKSTLENFWCFFCKVNLGLASLVGMLLLCLGDHKQKSARPVIWIVLAIYALSSLILLRHIREMIQKSDWGTGIKNGMVFREPFPNTISQPRMEGDYEVGPTTVPERMDVLIGTRFDSSFLGAYSQWLAYHPGNVAYNNAVYEASKYFLSYQKLPTVFQESLVDYVADCVNGRMLKQDWKTGNWMVAQGAAVDRRIRRDLARGANDTLYTLDKAISELLARARFDVHHRESSLSFLTQAYLIDLQAKLFSEYDAKLSRQVVKTGRAIDIHYGQEVQNFKSNTKAGAPVAFRSRISPKLSSSLRWTAFPKDHFFRIGETALVQLGDSQELRATILGRRYDKGGDSIYDVGYENGDEEFSVSSRQLSPVIQLEEGWTIYCNRDHGLFFFEEAEIVTVKPHRLLDVEYKSDGETEYDVHPDNCRWD